jgi:hypothetical protein
MMRKCQDKVILSVMKIKDSIKNTKIVHIQQLCDVLYPKDFLCCLNQTVIRVHNRPSLHEVLLY